MKIISETVKTDDGVSNQIRQNDICTNIDYRSSQRIRNESDVEPPLSM